MNKITEEEIPVIRRNGDLRSKKDEKQFIRKRIYELEQELTHLRTQLKTNSTVL
jgi:ribosomal protein L29